MSTAFRALKPFARVAPAARRATAARCEVCGAPIGETHAHVVEIPSRSLACACGACAILFRERGAGGGRYRTVPERVIDDRSFAPGDAEWAAIGVPVRLAFLVRRGDEWTAIFPSPGGPVEAELSAEAARALPEAAPLAREVEPDVEALLLHRPRGGAGECFLVPLDACHELASLVRRSWRGIGGGEEAEQAIAGFLARLRERAAGAVEWRAKR